MTESGGRRGLDWWTIGRRLGGLLMIVGALVLGFVAFQLWGTGIQHARAQRELRTEFEQSLADAQLAWQSEVTVPPTTSLPPNAPTAGSTATSRHPTTTALTTKSSPRRATTSPPRTVPPTTSPPATTMPPPTVPPQPAFAPGDPVARLEIPRIGVHEIVVSGVEVENLRKGPGHYPQTPLPGQPGNAAIAGHRTTYGAPFFSIDELAPGDEIIVTTVAGRFVYRVTGTVVVSPTDVSVIAGTADARLTLTSCHPLYSASSRIIVTAQLDVEHSAPIATVPSPGPDETAPSSTAPARPTATTVAPKRVTTTTSATKPHRPASTASTTTPTTSTTDSTDLALADAFGGSGGTGGSSAQPSGPTSAGGTPAVPSLGSGWFDDTSALVDILLWGAACLGIVLMIRWATGLVGHRFLFSTLGVVPFAVALFFFYENLNRVLPAGV